MFRRCTLARLLRRSAVLLANDLDRVFERYSEIENSNTRRINGIKMNNMFNDEWIATEKVHGANFGIYSVDHGKAIRYAKRSGLMPPTEHFFGYHVLLPELTKFAEKGRELFAAQLGFNPYTFIINGELFGGKYDHPSVPRRRQSVMVAGKSRLISAVQIEPFPQYSPDLHFYAFDIKYKLNRDDAEYTTLTYDEATAIFEKIPNLLYAKAIIRGPLSKVAAFDVETFTTTIPPLVGMGNYPLRGNWAEGLVVKHHLRGKRGTDVGGLTILKFKSTAFQEISTDRSQGPRVDEMEEMRRQSILVSGVQLPDMESVIRDPEVRAATQHLLNHVCDNRLKSVLSKIGTDPFETRTMTPDALARLLAKDALKDFLKEAEPKIVTLPLLTRREMVRYVVFESRKYIASKWKEIVTQQQEAAGESDEGVERAYAS